MEASENTKYEKARMIGARALQIAMGAPFLITLEEDDLKELKFNPVEIAKREYAEGVIPLKIVRNKPRRHEYVDKDVREKLDLE